VQGAGELGDNTARARTLKSRFYRQTMMGIELQQQEG